MKNTKLIFIIVLILFALSIIGLAKVCFTFGTGSPDGTYYSLGVEMADFWTKLLKTKDIEVHVESTADSIETCRLVGSKEIQFGITMSDVAFNAYKGLVQFEGKAQPILGLFSICAAYQHILTLDSNIKSIKDLEWKKIAIGKPGSRDEVLLQLIIEASGLRYSDLPCCTDVEVIYYSQIEEAIQDLKDEIVDAVFWNISYPNSAVQEVCAVRDVYFVPIDDDVIKKLVREYDYYKDGEIPANIYKGQDYNVKTVQVGNDVVINKDIDKNTAYLLVKTLFENAKYLIDVNPVTNQLIPENGVKTSVPLHPGAEKYFKDLGLLRSSD